MSARPHLYGLTPNDLHRLLAEAGVRADEAEARRLLASVFAAPTADEGLSRAAARRRSPPVPGASEPLRHVRPVGRTLLREVEARFDRRPLEVVEKVTDPADQFTKYLLRSPDGALHEAVRIPLHKPGAFSVCLSSQVGCAMQCAFCATGRLGLSRNLEAWEIVAAFQAVRADTEEPGSHPDRRRVTGAVFQGQGEPFHNYDEVLRAARILCDPCGGRIGARNITISTVGLVPQIRRYAREGHRYRLIVSLTSANAERRLGLLPVAGRFPLEEVAGALREYAAVAPGRVTVAWVLLGGVNDSAEEARALGRLLGDLPLRVNLIDVNDARPVEQGGFRRSTDAEREAFVDALRPLRVPIVRRYSGGAARHAACGMLAAVRLGSAPDDPPTTPPAIGPEA